MAKNRGKKHVDKLAQNRGLDSACRVHDLSHGQSEHRVQKVPCHIEHIKKYVKHTANHQAQYDFSYKGLHHVKGTKSHDLSGSASDSGRNQETEG